MMFKVRSFIFIGVVLLLASCAHQPQEPKTVLENYRRFIQQNEMPLKDRSRIYLGFQVDNSLPKDNLRKAIKISSKQGNAVASITFSFDRLVSDSYGGMVRTQFNPSVVCITKQSLSQVGIFTPGLPTRRHGFNSSNQYVVTKIIPSEKQNYLFRLSNGNLFEAGTVFSGDCLTELRHWFWSN